jgi:hypothetical protein
MCVIIFMNISSHAQNKSGKVEITRGEVFDQAVCDKHTYLGKDESGYYFKGDCAGTSLQKTDMKLTMLRSEAISFKKDKVNKDRGFVALQYFNDKIYAFSASDIKEKGQMVSTLFVQTFDKSTLQLNEDVLKLTAAPAGKNEVAAIYNMLPSPDNSKLLVAVSLPLSKEKDIVKYRFLVYDKDFKKLWEKEQLFSYTSDNFFFEEVSMDNNATVVLSFTVSRENEKPEMPLEKHLLVLTNNGTDAKDYTLKPEGKKPSSLRTAFDKDGNIICAGFYTEKGWQFGKGWYFMKINAQAKEISFAKTGAFEKSFISNASGDKSIDNAKCVYPKDVSPELESYSADKLQPLDNGSMVLITEQNYETTRTDEYSRDKEYGKPAETVYLRESSTWYCNDIVAVSFSPEGSIQWIKRIPKLQKILDKDYGSYFYAFVNNKLHFLYSWFPASMNSKPNELMLSSKYYSYSVYHVTLDEVGSVTTDELYTMVKDDYNLFRPGYKQISDSELVTLAMGDRIAKRKIIKFKFNP